MAYLRKYIIQNPLYMLMMFNLLQLVRLNEGLTAFALSIVTWKGHTNWARENDLVFNPNKFNRAQ